jgi:hypothetical protein
MKRIIQLMMYVSLVSVIESSYANPQQKSSMENGAATQSAKAWISEFIYTKMAII